MKRKALSVILALTMLASVFTGCAKEAEPSKETTQAVEETKEESTEEAPAEEEKGEPVTLTMEIYDRGNMSEEYGTPIDNKWVDLFKEKALEELNINLEYVAVPRTGDSDQIQLMMSAGNEPDIIHTYGQDYFLNWVEQELVADLSEYITGDIEKELMEGLGEEVLAAGKVDGKQYSINQKSYELTRSVSQIRKDLLDEVGVELRMVDGQYVITPSELLDAMTKIKEAGLCEYPVWIDAELDSAGRSSAGYYTMEGFAGAFLKDVTEEEVLNGLCNTEEFKEGVRYMNTLYNAGLINPDFALYAGAERKEAVIAGDWAFFHAKTIGYPTNYTEMYKSFPDAEIVLVHLVHEDGSMPEYLRASAAGAYLMVSSNCENVEAAVKLLNWLANDEDAHLLCSHGIEGENYYLEDGMKLTTPEMAEYNKTDRISCSDLNMYMNFCSCFRDRETWEKQYATSSANTQNSKSIDFRVQYESYGNREGNFMLPVINEVIETAVDYTVELTENFQNLMLGSIVAAPDKFDEVYDNYLEIYLEEGGAAEGEERLAAMGY